MFTDFKSSRRQVSFLGKRKTKGIYIYYDSLIHILSFQVSKVLGTCTKQTTHAMKSRS